jgi:hypothetical protein
MAAATEWEGRKRNNMKVVGRQTWFVGRREEGERGGLDCGCWKVAGPAHTARQARVEVVPCVRSWAGYQGMFVVAD